MTGWAAMTAYFRRLTTPAVPADERCSFCERKAVVHQTSLSGNPRVTTRRCLDHPPASAALSPCRDCGRPSWPDFHFDCDPEGADRG